ncbi:exopolysaccharide biosynthesis protein [Pseudoprimorskyibacter insulae]|uniref:Exopolysaccharide synthesis, ExoD n=1 Tax=Pseudoprimorskyibacter insulae TaxID=1695997 RepID=A0A2R8AXZ6_9RHOB|nr:exopolysaccharide biosynthesis protein [Pseudoprimorskyibacter insulae]SPF80911.1 hypothetical protein PRI8871_02724 [Pseudoprimorskyibacter insulae]
MTALNRPAPLLAAIPGRRLSQVLRDLSSAAPAQCSERVSVGYIVSALGNRSFAPLMVIFAAPNVFLFIPGSSVMTAIPLIMLAVQLQAGRPRVWLPGLITNRSMTRADFDRLVAVTIPYVERIETLAKPRIWPGSGLLTEQVIGLSTLVLATILLLPIPFANGLPAAAIVMLAMGLSERDGIWLIAGLSLALISVAFVCGMAFAGGLAILNLVF